MKFSSLFCSAVHKIQANVKVFKASVLMKYFCCEWSLKMLDEFNTSPSVQRLSLALPDAVAAVTGFCFPDGFKPSLWLLVNPNLVCPVQYERGAAEAVRGVAEAAERLFTDQPSSAQREVKTSIPFWDLDSWKHASYCPDGEELVIAAIQQISDLKIC